MKRYFTEYDNKKVPVIRGAFGGGGGGGNQGFNEDPNSLFSTDILFILSAAWCGDYNFYFITIP